MNSCSFMNLNTSNVAYNVFTFNFFGEFNSVRVCEWSRLLINVVDVQHFTHELNDRLCLVKGSGGHYNERKTENQKQISITVVTNNNVIITSLPIKFN